MMRRVIVATVNLRRGFAGGTFLTEGLGPAFRAPPRGSFPSAQLECLLRKSKDSNLVQGGITEHSPISELRFWCKALDGTGSFALEKMTLADQW
jgi:hypothetical protein